MYASGTLHTYTHTHTHTHTHLRTHNTHLLPTLGQVGDWLAQIGLLEYSEAQILVNLI